LGAIVSFYFGARHQSKTQEFQQSITRTVALATTRSRAPSAATEETAPDYNPALEEWKGRS
jgi:hypothetical protein